MAGNSGKFRSYVWDPWLIISQIIAVQFTFYFCLGVWMFSIDKMSGRIVDVNQIFDGKTHSFSSLDGRVVLIVFGLNSLTNSVALWFIVQRAKQCLDFAFTAHFIHFLICWTVIGFPKNWVWWLINVVCITLTSVIGEYLCMRYEMKAIPISVGRT
ncbi:protein SYS1 homolog [Rhopilema esculentum]|uniref:protein SYS1 homolog n=1 Tax=Rhopilema esculentum TaxID=499914 RepID=UPI0031E3011D